MTKRQFLLLKIVIAAALLFIWVGFAVLKLTDIAPLIMFIQTTLTAMATHSIFTSNSKKDDSNEKEISPV